MDNFTAIRNGILEHCSDGQLPPFDLGLYVFLILKADWKSGIYTGCALTLAHAFNDPALKEHINKSLNRLRSRQYINYRKGDGSRGRYPILINKYHVTGGALSGHRLNAWKNGDLCQPEYEWQNTYATVAAKSRESHGRVVAPIQDLKTSPDVQDTLSAPRGASERKRGSRIPENFEVTEEHRTFALKSGLPDPTLHVDAFRDYWTAKAGKDAVKADWHATFRNWLRRASEMNNMKGKQSGTGNRAERVQADTIQAVREAKAALRDPRVVN